MANYEPNSARNLINRFIDSIGARDETGVVPFVQAWPKIVGTDKAAHSQVLDVKNGTVLIGVDHPAWLQRMHMDRTRIVARIQRDFPALNARNLAFTIVSEFASPWQGDTGTEESTVDRDRPERERADARHDGESATESRGTDRRDDDASGSDEDTVSSGSAVEDDEFQRHLAGLRRALEEKERNTGLE